MGHFTQAHRHFNCCIKASRYHGELSRSSYYRSRIWYARFLSDLRSSEPDLPIGLFNSGGCEVLARNRWHIYVSLPFFAALTYALYLITQSAARWEFFTTLDYEWDVIRGHRPYRWTIWVRGPFGLRRCPLVPRNRELNFTCTGLLYCARVHPFVCNTQHGWHG